MDNKKEVKKIIENYKVKYMKSHFILGRLLLGLTLLASCDFGAFAKVVLPVRRRIISSLVGVIPVQWHVIRIP